MSIKCWNIRFRSFLTGMNTSIFVYRDVKYHTRSCSGPASVIINNGKFFFHIFPTPFTFAVSNSAQIPNFSKRPEDPPWHNKHTRIDVVEFSPLLTQFWFTMAQSYREVAIMNPHFVAIGPKSQRWCPLFPLWHCLFPRRLQNWVFWAESDTVNMKGCSLFSGPEAWPLH